ncbi:MAG: aerobic carbon-monoxide dehydrogenase large subunit [Bradyrhizobium sp.]|nr:aerobic carbon-monoxide dehydrogenase large subunit [Bradyrhizobium sp.]
MRERYLGKSLNRLEDLRFLTGRGNYVADDSVPGVLHAYVLRSPHAFARIAGVDLEAARAVPGVAAVFTETDLATDGIGELPCITVIDAIEPIVVPPRPALARGVVRHVGDPVVCIIAESPEAAIAASEAVDIAYEPLPCVTAPAAALQPDAPLIWPEAPGNSAYLFLKGDAAAVAAAMASAAHIVECDLVNNRVVAAPLETRAAVGFFDRNTDRFLLSVTGQAVHDIRRQLATSVFKVPLERMRVVVPDVGGGFGMKNFVYPEYVLVLWAARKLGRPVRWVSERAEDFVSSAHGRDFFARSRLALDKRGRFLALEVRGLANMGAYLSSNGPISSTNAAGTAMGGVYDIPSIFVEVRGVFTNTPPVDAYRGAGKPEANYLIERLVNLASIRTGIDATRLRRRNIIGRFPHRTAMGMTIDGGRFAANLDEVIALADLDGFRKRRRASKAAGLLRGIGLACFLETARGAPTEMARAAFEADGTVSLSVGTHSNGQGHETAYPQVAADLLGLPIEVFRFHQGDTELLPGGHGHGGARSMHLGGTALVLAVEQLIEKGRLIAAHLLQAPADQVSFEDGSFVVQGTARAIAIGKVADAARDAANLPEGLAPGLEASATNGSDLYTFPNGCHVAEVEIDPDTGLIRLDRYTIADDFGSLINPRLALGQVHGGIAQGIGQSLLEQVVFDPGSGQLLSGSLMDYALPRAHDLPNFAGGLNTSEPTASNRLGVKGTGQAGCIAAPQTIMNAVLDALSPLGIDELDMPATPFLVWRAIQRARAKSS